jgi:hypothetical protein
MLIHLPMMRRPCWSRKRSKWKPKLLRLYVQRLIQRCVDMLTKLTSRIGPQPLVGDVESHKSPAGTLPYNLTDALGGYHARHQLNDIGK